MHARSMCFTAQAGRADELAELLVQVADALRSADGCVNWFVARNPDATHEVWVQELWASEEDAERALASSGSAAGPSPADVMALCAGPPQRTDLTPVGGVGLAS